MSTSSFNSLQTGNCIQTSRTTGPLRQDSYVSIPFKRETAFKLGCQVVDAIRGIEFQFPSNGKLHSNCSVVQSLNNLRIKFQFPSNGKLHSNDERN